jgi:hypothetical protein
MYGRDGNPGPPEQPSSSGGVLGRMSIAHKYQRQNKRKRTIILVLVLLFQLLLVVGVGFRFLL